MLAQIVTSSEQAMNLIATGLHYYLPSVSVSNLVVGLLAISKVAQLAYKHWTTDGTKLDKIVKLVGVVQEPTTTVIASVTKSASSGNGPTALIVGALLFGFTMPMMAQTNGVPNLLGTNDIAYVNLLQSVYDNVCTNGIVLFTAARKLEGNINRFSADYVYSISTYSGLVLGVDDIRSGGKSQNSILRGGVTFQTPIVPFKVWPKFVLNPFASALVATSTSNGDVGLLAITGVDWDWVINNNWDLDAALFFENATGEGDANGNYVGILAGVHFRF